MRSPFKLAHQELHIPYECSMITKSQPKTPQTP